MHVLPPFIQYMYMKGGNDSLEIFPVCGILILTVLMVKAVTWVTERRFDVFLIFYCLNLQDHKMYIQRIDIFISIFIALIRSSYEKQYILYNTGTTWRHTM